MVYQVTIRLTEKQIKKLEELTDAEYTREEPSGLYDDFLLSDDVEESIGIILENL